MRLRIGVAVGIEGHGLKAFIAGSIQWGTLIVGILKYKSLSTGTGKRGGTAEYKYILARQMETSAGLFVIPKESSAIEALPKGYRVGVSLLDYLRLLRA